MTLQVVCPGGECSAQKCATRPQAAEWLEAERHWFEFLKRPRIRSHSYAQPVPSCSSPNARATRGRALRVARNRGNVPRLLEHGELHVLGPLDAEFA
jgi:hypothetical protein